MTADASDDLEVATIVHYTASPTHPDRWACLVDCPFCLKEHTHGFDPADRDHGIRASHCHNGEYHLKLPPVAQVVKIDRRMRGVWLKYVRCPYCQDVHRAAMDPDLGGPVILPSACNGELYIVGDIAGVS